MLTMNFSLRSGSRTSRSGSLGMALDSADGHSRGRRNHQRLPPRRQNSINFLGPPGPVQPLSVQTVRANNRLMSTTTLFNTSLARKLGWGHISCAALCILLGIVALILRCQVAWLGSPLWSGLAFFMIAGIFGIAAGPNDSCTVVSFMVMSVMSAIVSFVMLIAMLVAASTEYTFCRHSCNAAYCTTVCDGQAARISVDVLVAVIGLIEFIVSIISVSISCRRTQATVSTQTVVQHFFPTSGGQLTIFTSGQNANLVTDQQTHTHMPLHVYEHPTVYPVTLPGSILSCEEEQSLPPQPSAAHQQHTSLVPSHDAAAPPPPPPLPPPPAPPAASATTTVHPCQLLPSTNTHGHQPAFITGEACHPLGVVSEGSAQRHDVVLPPYSQHPPGMLGGEGQGEGQLADSSAPASMPPLAPPPFTSILAPNTFLATDEGVFFPFGPTSVYPTLPPPYQPARGYHNM